MEIVLKDYRWRKASDVTREYALFELINDDVPVMDVGFSDDGTFEIAFNVSISGVVIDLEKFLELLEEGRALAERDRDLSS